jgi:hypothetical protein
MKKPLSTIKSKSLIKLLYKFVFPATAICSLLLISPRIPRDLFLGSRVLDLVTRIWLCIMFCMGYIILSDLERYQSWFYQSKKRNLSPDNDFATRIFNITMSIMLGIFATLISWWTIRTFLPVLDNFALALAVLNGVLFFAPLFFLRNHFSL